MKIVFVNLFDYIDIEEHSIPLGILSLASVLKIDEEFDVEVVDLHRVYSNKKLELDTDNLDYNIDQSTRHIMSFSPDCVSIYTMNNTHHVAVMLAKRIKELFPETTVALGGPQATITAEQTLRAFDFVDLIGLGEGEMTIKRIMEGVRDKDLTNVPGVAFRSDGKVIINVNDNLISDLDTLPIIDLSFLKDDNIGDILSIDAGRGCPYSCTFCSTKSFWKRHYRVKSPQRIVEELEHYIMTYGIKQFSFQHDLFLANKRTVLDLCELIEKKNLDIQWWCSSRIDTIDEEMIQKMSAAGCNSIYFGVEAGTPRMQKIINKNLNLAQMQNLISILKKYNISPTFSFIYGFPEETFEDVDGTLECIYNIYDSYFKLFTKDNVSIQLHKLVFLPKTEVTQKVFNELSREADYHIDASLSVDKWNNQYLNEIIGANKDIFSHYYDLNTELRNSLENLDIAFNTIYVNFIRYIDATYKLMYFACECSNLKLYLRMKEVLSEKEILKYRHYNYRTLHQFVAKMFLLFEKIVMSCDFFDYNDAIIDMFTFERDIYNFGINSHNDPSVIYKRKYAHDVIEMKKRRDGIVVRKAVEIEISAHDGVASAKRI